MTEGVQFEVGIQKRILRHILRIMRRTQQVTQSSVEPVLIFQDQCSVGSLISSQSTFDQSAVVDAHDHPVMDETLPGKVPEIPGEQRIPDTLYVEYECRSNLRQLQRITTDRSRCAIQPAQHKRDTHSGMPDRTLPAPQRLIQM